MVIVLLTDQVTDFDLAKIGQPLAPFLPKSIPQEHLLMMELVVIRLPLVLTGSSLDYPIEVE